MKLLIKNIGCLAGVYESSPGILKGRAMAQVPMLTDAWLAVEDGKFAAFGRMSEWPGISDWRDLEVLDAEGQWVVPGYCDSHTHLVYAASRAGEFSDRIRGMTYEQIAARGGGILNSAAKMASMPEEELVSGAMERLREVMQTGTTSIEIKSGYGLSVEGELKMLRVIRKLKELSPLRIKATFLGAHAYPAAFRDRKEEYVDLLLREMLPAVAAEGLADYVDVFCEENYFGVEDTVRIMEAAAGYGLKSKIHVNQFNSIGGIRACVESNAVSVDHLEVLTDEDLEILQSGGTIPVGLPGCSFFIGIPYTPARRIMDAGLPLALATDYNPGSCPSGNMGLVMSLACIHMGMTPEEAFNACTMNGAAAMEMENECGSVSPGKNADFLMIQPISELAELPYYFGKNPVRQVYIGGIRRTATQ